MTVQFQSPAALLGIAQDMIRKDWQPVWCPQRQSGSFSPEPGCTGGAPWMTILKQPGVAHKLAFRPPEDVLVIDVDEYEDKHGDATMNRAEAWLCELPETYRVTSRGFVNPSGRYLYRKPADLLVTDSSLYQFGEDGKTDVEIVRTGHRFSWAPGDYHYKNNQEILCFDAMGDVCDMPNVSELPELPAKWVNYLRNPPVPQRHEVYTRPSDGAEWWLSQADDSLGSDAELASFAYNMLLSRVPEEEIFAQWLRVSLAVDAAWPWDRKDFDRHLGSRAQYKADVILQHQDAETDWAYGTPGPDGVIEATIARQREEYENPRELRALMEPEIPVDEIVSKDLQALTPPPPVHRELTRAEIARSLIKKNPKYDDIYYREAAKQVVTRDVAELFAVEFNGFDDVSQFQEPDKPSLLQITGKGANQYSAVVIEGTITVLSAKRASGKTWVTSLWAAQVMRAGGNVFWFDFERQPRGLVQKLRSVGVLDNTMRNQLHYSAALAPPEYLLPLITAYRATGKPVLLVVDAFRTLQGKVAPGSSANDGDAVEQVYMECLTPAVDAGATVVLLDHMPKNGDGSTFGSERKESAADYVIRLEKVEPFSKVKPGFAMMTCGKDRYGDIAEGDPVGYLWVPGDGSKSGKSIEEYPSEPALRNWSPNEAAELAGVEVSIKARRESFLISAVAARPLHYTQSSLADLAKVEEPELFDIGAASIRTNIINKLVSGGLLEADVVKKLVVPVKAADPEPAGAKNDLAARLNPEDHGDQE